MARRSASGSSGNLGYKHAKFVMRIEARERIDNLYGGKGGYWEDVAGYQWYAGI